MIDGIEQGQRAPEALTPGYFRVDELGFEERVAISERLAARLAFIGLQGRAEGNWQPLFRGNELLLLAGIVADLDEEAAPALLSDDGPQAPARLAAELVRMAQALDGRLRDLHGANACLMLVGADPRHPSAARRVAQDIEKRIADHLAPDLADVVDAFGPADLFDRLLPLWRQAGRMRASADAGATAGAPTLRALRARRLSFIAALRDVRRLAQRQLLLSQASQQHEPAAALLAAFMRLHERVQQRINRFTDRHIDFYYLDCLRFRPRAAVADRAHLVCERDPRLARELRVPAGAAFAAGKDTEGRPIEYRAEASLDVTDARVAALCSLRLDLDPRISPERELGHVTRAQAQRIALVPQGESDAPWSLFGGVDAADAELGLALASPMLWLAEGEREIRLGFGFAHDPRGEARAVRRHLMALRRQATRAGFFRCFGRLFCRWLLAAEEALDDAARRRIHAAARRWMPELQESEHDAGSPLALLAGQPVERELAFHRVFEHAFSAHLTTPDGWFRVHQVHVVRPPAGSGHAIEIGLRLRQQDPAITACLPELHGERWEAGLPMLRLALIRESRQFTYSLLTELDLSEVRLQVSVRGVRSVTLANQLGRLDPAKPFQPFGPLPELGSYLVIGSREIACKEIDALEIGLQWSGLPAGDGGFAEHYAGYEQRIDNDSFRVDAALLRDGLWQRPEAGLRDARLFASRPGSAALLPERRLVLEPATLRRLFRPDRGAMQADDFQYDLRSRNGFVKLQLAQPPGAFGHREHPLLLTQVVSANARHRRALPLPNPPYTPLLERITLDYRASCKLRVAGGDDAANGCGRLYHLHPFGIERVDGPEAGRRALLPRYPAGGHLMIGIDTREPQGLLTLLFHLSDEAASARAQRRPMLQWSWLRGNRWLPLPPARLLSDTTEGLLTSGIVMIDLPPGMSSEHSVMPSGLYWLRVSARQGFDSLAGLYGVRTQAMVLARHLGESAPDAVLPAGRIAEPLAGIPGLASVMQVGPSFGLRRRESAAQLRVRAGERLRHRQRACTAWDIERLLLEQFPSVFKLKCFARRRSDVAGECPGHVLVAVVPAAAPGAVLQMPRFNAGELERMADFLASLAPPFMAFEVRNAAYELVQVRCSVQLRRGAHVGSSLQRLDEAIAAYLSPWCAGGRSAGFDWSLRCEDVESHIRSLPDVEQVSGLSLLRVAEDDEGRYALSDTARPASGASRAEATLLRCRVPWSIAVPMRRHIIDLDGNVERIAPRASGITQLAIGGTFIIGGA